MEAMTLKQREDYILEYWPLAKLIAYNACKHNGFQKADVEDCLSYITEKIICAIDSYDESKKATLTTFVNNQIRFAVKEYFRDLPGGRFRKGAYEDNRTQKGWEVTRAYALNFGNPIDVSTLENSLQYSNNGTNDKVYRKEMLHEVFNVLNNIDSTGAINSRSDHAEIFKLYFMNEYTQQEIADMKSCTKANISLTIRKTIPKIQKHLKPFTAELEN
jgi:RNA polymerase sigma factor (sigma-70 family)